MLKEVDLDKLVESALLDSKFYTSLLDNSPDVPLEKKKALQNRIRTETKAMIMRVEVEFHGRLNRVNFDDITNWLNTPKEGEEVGQLSSLIAEVDSFAWNKRSGHPVVNIFHNCLRMRLAGFESIKLLRARKRAYSTARL